MRLEETLIIQYLDTGASRGLSISLNSNVIITREIIQTGHSTSPDEGIRTKNMRTDNVLSGLHSWVFSHVSHWSDMPKIRNWVTWSSHCGWRIPCTHQLMSWRAHLCSGPPVRSLCSDRLGLSPRPSSLGLEHHRALLQIQGMWLSLPLWQLQAGQPIQPRKAIWSKWDTVKSSRIMHISLIEVMTNNCRWQFSHFVV